MKLENERKSFEYDFTKRKGNSRELLRRDPDRRENYADAHTNLVWQGWQAGVVSYEKRKG